MKQKQRNENSKKRILAAALQEFGTNEYHAASLNNICNKNNISKGLVYHYFGGKDELFLLCVKECFDKMVSCLKEKILLESEPKINIKNYFHIRNMFFEENKELRQVFRSAVLQPPAHLKEQIAKLHQELKELNHLFAKSVLKKLPLRKGITVQEAMDYFIAYEDFFDEYLRRQQVDTSDTDQLVELREKIIYDVFDRMLYGIAIQEKL